MARKLKVIKLELFWELGWLRQGKEYILEDKKCLLAKNNNGKSYAKIMTIIGFDISFPIQRN